MIVVYLIVSCRFNVNTKLNGRCTQINLTEGLLYVGTDVQMVVMIGKKLHSYDKSSVKGILIL